jgi:hypothetical protein
VRVRVHARAPSIEVLRDRVEVAVGSRAPRRFVMHRLVVVDQMTIGGARADNRGRRCCRRHALSRMRVPRAGRHHGVVRLGVTGLILDAPTAAAVRGNACGGSYALLSAVTAPATAPTAPLGGITFVCRISRWCGFVGFCSPVVIIFDQSVAHGRFGGIRRISRSRARVARGCRLAAPPAAATAPAAAPSAAATSAALVATIVAIVNRARRVAHGLGGLLDINHVRIALCGSGRNGSWRRLVVPLEPCHSSLRRLPIGRIELARVVAFIRLIAILAIRTIFPVVALEAVRRATVLTLAS